MVVVPLVLSRYSIITLFLDHCVNLSLLKSQHPVDQVVCNYKDSGTFFATRRPISSATLTDTHRHSPTLAGLSPNVLIPFLNFKYRTNTGLVQNERIVHIRVNDPSFCFDKHLLCGLCLLIFCRIFDPFPGNCINSEF